MERFQGCIVHPRAWPEDLDFSDKQIVVIGSGATAVTLIPALAKAHATRSCCSVRQVISSQCPDS